jgi:conjugal transfer pilus assembly protein TraI
MNIPEVAMAFPFLRSVLKKDHPERPRIEPELKAAETAGTSPDCEGTPFTPRSRQDLLQDCEEILRRIRLCYGREPEQFERDILAIVVRYADYVNALPATANNYYCYPGGLFRLGLDTAFFSLQATDAQIFEGRATITQRRHLEPRWRHATFIAGLCAALQPTLNTVTVTGSDEACWPSYLQTLASWLEARGGTSFRLLWRPPPHIDGLQNLYALPHIIPPATMEYLAARNEVVVPTMLATLSRLPLSRPPATMGALVRRAAALAIDKELRRMASARGVALQGDHLAHLLVDIMHDLVHSAASWIPNSEKSRVWHAEDGTLVVWPDAYQDIAAYADRDRLHGLPPNAEIALAALQGAGMIACDDANPLWSFRAPEANGDRSCIKLAAPELVLGLQLLTCPLLPPLCQQRVHVERMPAAPTPPEPRAESSEASNGVEKSNLPSQLELRLAESPGEESPLLGAETQESNERSTGAPSLVKCMRLPADVADVVRRAVASLTETDDPARARLVRDGVLIPMQALKSTGLDTRMVIRCLRDAGMLVVGEAGNPTCTTTLDGTELRGLVLKRRYVTGLAPA